MHGIDRQARQTIPNNLKKQAELPAFWMEDSTMDLQNTNLQGGSLQISTEVIGKIARCAALEMDGVAEVSCGVQKKS